MSVAFGIGSGSHRSTRISTVSSFQAGNAGASSPYAMDDDDEDAANLGEVDDKLGRGKDELLSTDIIDGLRSVQEKIKDVRQMLDIYRLTKADAGGAMTQLEGMRRQLPGGVPWDAIADLEHKVTKTMRLPNADFDNLIQGQHEMQVQLGQVLRDYLTKKAAAHKAARFALAEAGKAAGDAEMIIRGDNPDIVGDHDGPDADAERSALGARIKAASKEEIDAGYREEAAQQSLEEAESQEAEQFDAEEEQDEASQAELAGEELLAQAQARENEIATHAGHDGTHAHAHAGHAGPTATSCGPPLEMSLLFPAGAVQVASKARGQRTRDRRAAHCGFLHGASTRWHRRTDCFFDPLPS
eukprot:TRINITY_DN60571_c0_g1_i1.p1 TRINITY_DN60571_c0_g1~~TRINITY_DN60571_c0_g1_i1.p1  ORF type:complete len:386 (+),score=83.61 TRINITY_DN60571_c0_g1_i1:91-1158(+)